MFGRGPRGSWYEGRLASMSFLQDATTEMLLRAVAANHTAWFARHAEAAGGRLYRQEGAPWAYQPAPGGSVSIMFPRPARAQASEQLDAILAFCRREGVTT